MKHYIDLYLTSNLPYLPPWGVIGDKFSSGFSQMPISQGRKTLSPQQDHTWYYPTHAFSKKQTAVGISSKEAEVHSVFTYLLAMSDPNAPAEVRQQKAGLQAKPKAPMPKDRVLISNWSGFRRNSVSQRSRISIESQSLATTSGTQLLCTVHGRQPSNHYDAYHSRIPKYETYGSNPASIIWMVAATI